MPVRTIPHKARLRAAGDTIMVSLTQIAPQTKPRSREKAGVPGERLTLGDDDRLLRLAILWHDGRSLAEWEELGAPTATLSQANGMPPGRWTIARDCA